MLTKLRNIAILSLVVFGLGYYAAQQSEICHQNDIQNRTEVHK